MTGPPSWEAGGEQARQAVVLSRLDAVTLLTAVLDEDSAAIRQVLDGTGASEAAALLIMALTWLLLGELHLRLNGDEQIRDMLEQLRRHAGDDDPEETP